MVRRRIGRRGIAGFAMPFAGLLASLAASAAPVDAKPGVLHSDIKREGMLIMTATRERVSIPVRKPARRGSIRTVSLAADAASRGKLLLHAGALEARIDNARHDTRVRAGSSRFIDIVLKNPSDSDIGQTRLLLVGSGARLVRVENIEEGRRIKTRRAGDNHVITVGRVKGHASRTVVLELRLNGVTSSEDGGTRATVRLALSIGANDGTAPDSTQLDWAVAHPAKDYHRALRRIDAENGEEIYAAVQEARVGSPDLPGRWYFAPRTRKPKAVYETIERKKSKRVCARYRRATRAERRRARKRGRRIRRRCARHETREITRKIRVRVKQAVSEISKSERRMLALAANAVKSKGAAPLLRKPRGKFGWISSRIAVDLRNYMGQPAHPALCTGMDVYMDYLHDNAVSFRARIAEMHRSREQAPGLASTHIEDLRRQLRTQPGGHPGTGGAPLSILKPFPADADVLMNLSELAGHVVALTASPDDGRMVAGTTDILVALKHASDAVKSPTFTSQSRDVQRTARRALTMIEASHYLRLGDDHYVRVEKALFGGIKNVRKAHAQTCVASG